MENKKKDKLLILSSRFPYPLEKGDKLRLYHQIKSLSEVFDIYLFALSDEDVQEKDFAELIPLCKEIELKRISKWICYINLILGAVFKGLPLQVAYFYSKAAQKSLNSFIAKHPIDKVYCQLIRMAEYTKEINIEKHLDYMDAFSMGVERRKDKAFWLKPILGLEYGRVKAYERTVFTNFNSHSIIADADRRYIFGEEAEKVKLLANGVDMGFFTSNPSILISYDVLFVGNMSYPPNIAAVKFLIEKVMPLVWEQSPNCSVLIAGTNPDSSIKKYASSKVKISGWMEDIRMAYWQSKVFVAPMFLGSGLQNKLLEAMAVGLPCITTDLANNSLKASRDEIRIANNANEFCVEILHLLNEGNNGNIELIKKAKSFVKESYGWNSHNQRLVKSLLLLCK